MATSRTEAPPALSAQRNASGFARRCITRAALLLALLASQIRSMPVRPANGQLWIEGDGSTPSASPTQTMAPSKTAVGNVASCSKAAFKAALAGGGLVTFSTGDCTIVLSSSAAINAGTTPGPDVTSDVDGDARPQQGGYDVGYDESPYQPPSVPISTSVVVVPELGATLTTTSALVEVPAGAITQTITLVYEPLTATGAPPSGTLVFAGLAFSLTAFQDGSPLSGFAFERPVTVTLRYTDADVMGLVEANLQPFYFNATTGLWQTDGIVVVGRNLPENKIVFAIWHLTRFGLFAPTQQRAFVPVIMRDGSPISGVP